MKVAMVINTTGLQYDDRLRKESLMLQREGFDVEIMALEYANQAEVKLVYGGIPARTISLKSRRWFARTRVLSLKAIEMWILLLRCVIEAKPNIVWFHCVGMMGLAPFLILLRKLGKLRLLVWDQHELPPDRLLNNKIFLRFFTSLLNGCDLVLMASDERRRLIKDSLGKRLRTQIEVLNNYPDQQFATLPKGELPKEIWGWLGGCPYILAQGGANPERNLDELVEAVINLEGIRLVVVGPYQLDQVERLCNRFGITLSTKVFFTGFVPQMELVPYIDQALTSVVFYDMGTTNSRLCAPNRLYQALARHIPVVVSQNPPLRAVVDQYRCGVAVDATDPAKIKEGLESLIANEETYRKRAAACSGLFLWERQPNPLELAADSTRNLS